MVRAKKEFREVSRRLRIVDNVARQNRDLVRRKVRAEEVVSTEASMVNQAEVR